MLDRIAHQGRRYRLVWCLRDASPFLGVISCFRRGKIESFTLDRLIVYAEKLHPKLRVHVSAA